MTKNPTPRALERKIDELEQREQAAGLGPLTDCEAAQLETVIGGVDLEGVAAAHGLQLPDDGAQVLAHAVGETL